MNSSTLASLQTPITMIIFFTMHLYTFLSYSLLCLITIQVDYYYKIMWSSLVPKLIILCLAILWGFQVVACHQKWNHETY